MKSWSRLPLLLLAFCAGSCGTQAQLLSPARSPQVVVTKPVPVPSPPGQSGPTQELVASLEGKRVRLTARRSDRQGRHDQRPWLLELRQGSTVLARWPAVSGTPGSQNLERRWSPGNGAPLPMGEYNLAPPEPWGEDIWVNLTPRFDTRRSGLGNSSLQPRQRLPVPAGSSIPAGSHRLDAEGRPETPECSELSRQSQPPCNAS